MCNAFVEKKAELERTQIAHHNFLSVAEIKEGQSIGYRYEGDPCVRDGIKRGFDRGDRLLRQTDAECFKRNVEDEEENALVGRLLVAIGRINFVDGILNLGAIRERNALIIARREGAGAAAERTRPAKAAGIKGREV
jgi:hypothetical protein